MESKKKTSHYTYAVGRRKRSVARVRLFAGKGQTEINGQPIGVYFKDIPSVTFFAPFEVTGTSGKYYATAKIEGGGRSGQVGAFVHGLSRALAAVDETGKFRSALKTAGLLTRDSREKERRKPGLAQAARAKKQSPKR